MTPNVINDGLYQDEINFNVFFRILLESKLIIFLCTFLATSLAVLYSISLPNIYQSSAIIAPSQNQNSISGALNSYSGLANLAGINLPSQTNSDNSSQAIVKISTFSFFENNILPNLYLPNLFAVKSWNQQTNELVYDKSIYDETDEKWVRNFSYPQSQIPSAQESFDYFHDNNLSVSEDKKTGFVTITVKHQSPHISKNWATLVLNEINTFYSNNDKKEAENAINFLNQAMAKSNYSELRELIAEIIQEEIKKLTLIEANKYYVYEVIDPPFVEEKKVEPQRALISILGTILGFITGVILAIIRNTRNNDLKYKSIIENE